ncbi:MAG TPA: hypothetical protein DCS28_04180 [Candidatus Moranbacteria bacterium]|nr:hypothetical protein [Candidatus Moranbacteria bacterium]HAT75207.1 hypothetical protein [Candidatus Moranbacteria bacterium]
MFKFANFVQSGIVRLVTVAGFPPTKGDQEIANAIKELSRLTYGRDRHIVNQEIIARTRF